MITHTTGRGNTAAEESARELAGADCSCTSSLAPIAIDQYAARLYETVMSIYTGRDRGHKAEAVKVYFEGIPWKCIKPTILEVLLASAMCGKDSFERIFKEVETTIPLPEKGEKRECYCENPQIDQALTRWCDELRLH